MEVKARPPLAPDGVGGHFHTVLGCHLEAGIFDYQVFSAQPSPGAWKIIGSFATVGTAWLV